MRILENEELRSVYLDPHGGILEVCTIAHGDTFAIELSAYAALRLALLCGSRMMLLAHNHPSQNTAPSADDLRFLRIFDRTAHDTGVVLDKLVIVTSDGINEVGL
ncbi:MAG: hypothetical protein H6506_03360 [Calditrichaeota bacterium]|nr:hypothetical protein [Calditrichota bacterium]MCB9366257.1 hypothetical protein [Calditrichota bacterium]MCB9391674.1 hypothetical protein [Calditrichota bacterium]